MDSYVNAIKKTVVKARADAVDDLFEHLSGHDDFKALNLSEAQVAVLKTVCESFKESLLAKKKREPTQFNLFTKQKMAEIKAKNPDLPHKEIMKLVSKEWNESGAKAAAGEAKNKALTTVSESEGTASEVDKPKKAAAGKAKKK